MFATDDGLGGEAAVFAFTQPFTAGLTPAPFGELEAFLQFVCLPVAGEVFFTLSD